MNKHNSWIENLPSSTRKYLEQQPIWHDRDMIKAVLYGIAIGLFFGIIFGYGLGLPDYSNMPVTYVRG